VSEWVGALHASPCVLPATLDDAPAIARIHVEAWRAAYEGIIPAAHLAGLSVQRREVVWRESIAKGGPDLLVAKTGDSVIGWIAFGACRDADAAEKQGEIQAIYLDPSHWAQGVGRLLLQAARERLAAQGFTRASLWVLADNARALRFYRAAGFAPDPSGRLEIERGGKLLVEVRYLSALNVA
jgi:ribosomal protein S18 acetylase RimI-like enzyme